MPMRLKHSTQAVTLALPLFLLAACGGGGSSSDSSTTSTVPGAPTIGAATAGNASASIAFTAPSSNGGSAITDYTATCSAGTASRTGTGTASPITVSSLTNSTAYSCSVTATNAIGMSAASGAVSVTPAAASSSGSTAGVECSYNYNQLNSASSVNLMSTANWSCSGSARVLAANGVPDHAVGAFPNPGNPNTIAAQTVAASYTLNPVLTTTVTTTLSGRAAIGYMLNGVKIEANTAGSCNDTGTICHPNNGNSENWNMEALGQTSFNFGLDGNNAHVQATGAYHYHGMPVGFLTRLGGDSAKMTLIGWAADGFPIYARYGYSVATDARSALKVMMGSYQFVTPVPSTRPSVSTYALGTFAQDWRYVAGSGDLDECNGRYGVTPEFPNGTYHYYATDSYPFLQRCVKGAVS